MNEIRNKINRNLKLMCGLKENAIISVGVVMCTGPVVTRALQAGQLTLQIQRDKASSPGMEYGGTRCWRYVIYKSKLCFTFSVDGNTHDLER